MVETTRRTTTDQTGGDHVRARLTVKGETTGEDYGRGDEVSEHGEGMLKTSGHGYDNRKLAVERVERWADLSSLALEATGEREGQSGHAEPCVVVVTEPAMPGGNLVVQVRSFSANDSASAGVS